MGWLNSLWQIFVSFGPFGMLLGLFLIVFFDAIIIPIGPELLAIAIYTTNLNVLWAAIIVMIVAIAQLLGCTVLYQLGKYPKILPKFMKKIMYKYKSFLLIKTEKIVFINCFVPVLPFVGAFIAISKWNYARCMFYVVLGGAIKYSLFLSMSRTFYYLFESGIAQKVSLLAVFCLLVASGLYALYKKKKVCV